MPSESPEGVERAKTARRMGRKLTRMVEESAEGDVAVDSLIYRVIGTAVVLALGALAALWK